MISSTIGGVDIGDRLITDHRVSVGAKSALPLDGVLAVAPAGSMRLDVALGAGPEGDLAGGGEQRLHPLAAAFLERVGPIEQHLATDQRLVARLGQGDQLEGAEAHAVRYAIPHVAEHPALGAGGADLDIEIAADPPDTQPADRGDFLHGQRAHLSVPRLGKPISKWASAWTDYRW
jgi:hypothetical protein